MPIEVTWTEDDGDDYADYEEQLLRRQGQEEDEEENLSRSPYSGDDEYEEEDKQTSQRKFEDQWEQFNAVSDVNDPQLQDLQLQEEPQEVLPEEQQEWEQQKGEPTGEIRPDLGPLVAVEATYMAKPPSHRGEDSYLCGLASIILEHCDPRGNNKVEDSATQVTLIMDNLNDTSGDWEHLVTPKGVDDEPLLLPTPLDDQDNRSMDGSIRSTRTTATQETERTAIETEFAPVQLRTRTKSKRTSSFLKWKRPNSSKKKENRPPIIIPPVENESSTPRSTAVEKESVPPTPAPMEISTSPLDLQREVSLLEFDDVHHADKDMRIIGLSMTESFDRENSRISPTPLTDGDVSDGESYYDDDDEATLLSDPRNNHTQMVKPIQSIEVIYDPHLFDEEEEKIGEGTRYCSLWPLGAKKARGRFYR